MPLYQFNSPKHEFIRKQLRLGGSFWEGFRHLSLERGSTFTYLPVDCSGDLAARLDESVLGDFEDTACFREEEEFILRHVRASSRNVALLGINLSQALIAKSGRQFLVLPVRSVPDDYYGKVLVLHGAMVTSGEVRAGLSISESPFSVGALLETPAEDPLKWLEDELCWPSPRLLLECTVSLMLEAYRGEGLLFWLAEGRELQKRARQTVAEE